MSKPVNVRLKEMIEVYKEFEKYHINEYNCLAIVDFKKLTNAFIKDGVEAKGVIHLEEIEYDIEYNLSNFVGVASVVVLRANSDTRARKRQRT
jgi:hypothetical protein